MDTANPQQPDIFTRLGMVSASDEQKQKLLDQIGELTMIRVLNKASDKLGEAAMAEIEALVDSGNSEAVDQKLRQLIPDFDTLLSTTAREVGDQLVADQQAVLAQARK